VNSLRESLNQQGFAVVPGVLDDREVGSLLLATSISDDESAVRRRSGVYAVRNLLNLVPAVAELSNSPKVIGIAREVLGPDAIPVKGTLFDKAPGANWLVPWHQDLTICVNSRVDTDGYGPWTTKAGVVNVQPPVPVLERMLAIRIHLDDCNAQNGALRILPRSHIRGRLKAEQIAAMQAETAPITCEVERGGVVLMKPLVLHASSPARDPRHRRVIHIDFAAVELPPRLAWFTAAQFPTVV
jgi:ectoine hydroxylase-related dioxygenase (phytanoyl-CoA dioxygenase family)